MRSKSLIVLGAIFASAFFGRAGVLAAALAEDGSSKVGATSDGEQVKCIDGRFAESLKRELLWIETEKARMADEKSMASVLTLQVEKRIGELEALNQALAAKIERDATAGEQTKTQVGAIYAQMKPDAASQIIGEMDPQFAASLLLSMSGDNASEILASLPPTRAYAITVLMAGSALNN